MLNIAEETHRELYYDLKASLDFSKLIKGNTTRPMIFHLYWDPKHIGFGRRHVLTIKSILATQNKGSKVIFWSPSGIGNNWTTQIAPYIEFATLDINLEIAKLNLDRNFEPGFYLNNYYAGGDFIRYLLLYNYGGVWVDADMILLRNLSPFLDQEFAYKWQYMEGINAALCHFRKGEDVALSLIKEIFNTPLSHIASWSRDLLYNVYVRDKSFSVFPCSFFDPSWLNDENEFFDNASKFNDELYDGAFSVHLHNTWKAQITENCRFEKYEKLIEEKFNEVI